MTRSELFDQIKSRRTFLCVGLDTDLKKIPQDLLNEPNPIFAFNKAIIDATAPYCIAYKPNIAFYEADGIRGWEALELTAQYLKENYPAHLLIADAKRGDIGNTSSMYARAFFEDLKADALTVAPYMGSDSVQPFATYEDKWVILLALTSNKGSSDFQRITDADGTPLYEHVMRTAMTWVSPDQLMFVVGATQGKSFEDIRRIAPEHFLLVPGVGAQGGSMEEVCRYGMNKQCGLIVNSSRGIIYASTGADFAERAAQEAAAIARNMDKALTQAGI